MALVASLVASMVHDGRFLTDAGGRLVEHWAGVISARCARPLLSDLLASMIGGLRFAFDPTLLSSCGC